MSRYHLSKASRTQCVSDHRLAAVLDLASVPIGDMTCSLQCVPSCVLFPRRKDGKIVLPPIPFQNGDQELDAPCKPAQNTTSWCSRHTGSQPVGLLQVGHSTADCPIQSNAGAPQEKTKEIPGAQNQCQYSSETLE